MSDTTKLTRKDVKKEVKRINKLPEYELDRQMKELHKKVSVEIESTCAKIDNNQYSFVEKARESRRLLYCVMAIPKDYRKSIYELWDKAFGKVLKNPDNINYITKTKTAHVSGLPLPEQAEVNVWWQNDKLMFATEATEFSLPIERVMGMGTTGEVTAAAIGGQKTYLTIEYRKENEIKHIVVKAIYSLGIREIKKHYDQIKGTREANRQEL